MSEKKHKQKINPRTVAPFHTAATERSEKMRENVGYYYFLKDKPPDWKDPQAIYQNK